METTFSPDNVNYIYKKKLNGGLGLQPTNTKCRAFTRIIIID